MTIVVNVEKKTFRTDKGEQRFYYSLTGEVSGVSIRFRADDKDKKLLTHLLDGMDIPVTADDDKNALIEKLLNGEVLTEAERQKLESYIGEGDK